VFLGLPIELLPEEARILVDKNVAYIVDDANWHFNNFCQKGDDQKRYMEALRSQGRTAKKAMEQANKKKQESAMIKHAAARAQARAAKEASQDAAETAGFPATNSESQEDTLFGGERSSSRASTTRSEPVPKDYHAVTPGISYGSDPAPSNVVPQSLPEVPPSYPLFKHLHDKNYFMMPGLRFGGNYNVYPGDPLRFHSHFLATGYEWDQEIPLLDLIGGGRLGTAVKKGFLIGGKEGSNETDGESDGVRTFCLEWGGM